MATGTQKILQKALAVHAPGTRYGLAKRLGMSQSNLQKALDGKLHLGPKPAVLLAEVLDLDPIDVIAVCQGDGARSADDKEFWHRKVPRFLQAIALGLALVPAGAGYFGRGGPNGPSAEPIYIMRTRRRAAA